MSSKKSIRSQIETVHRIKTDRVAGMNVLVKYLGPQDKEILEKTYDDARSVAESFLLNNIRHWKASRTS